MATVPIPKHPQKNNHRRSRPLSPHTIFVRRLGLLTASFVVVCLIYSIILISLQSRGNAYSVYKEPSLPAGTTVQTVTLQAVRGEIYDRNGNPLVTNRYSYDLIIDHDPFITDQSADVRNRMLLSLIDRLAQDDSATLYEDSFPFDGIYPNLTYTQQAKDSSSELSSYLQALLTRMDLPADTSENTLISYYVKKHSLGAATDGIPLYTNEQITSLLRIYYDMDLCRFGTDAAEYTLALDVSAAVVGTGMEASMPGVRYVVRSERVYHYPGYASHILGRVNKIFAEDWEYYHSMGYPMNAIVGSAGCESAFESILHGTDGEMEITLDENGQVLRSTVTREPIAGQDIRLTIDIQLQITAEDALREQLTAAGLSKGSVVMTDPNTGEYLVIASYPTYDLTTFSEDYDILSKDPNTPMLNRALSGLYSPGTLLRWNTALAGLDCSSITPSTLWQDGGILKVGNETLLCPRLIETNTSHGVLGVSTALTDGCDIFIGELGLLLGKDRLSSYEALLGLGQKTKIELSEGQGSASSLPAGNETALLRAAIGDSSGAGMTPAQMNAFLSTILTGGKRYRGHILKDVRNFTSGDVTESISPEILRAQSLRQDAVAVLKYTMQNMASDDTILHSLSEDFYKKGITLGTLFVNTPSGTIDDDHALRLFYTVSENQTVTLSVVVENGEESVAATVIGGEILQFFHSMS